MKHIIIRIQVRVRTETELHPTRHPLHFDQRQPLASPQENHSLVVTGGIISLSQHNNITTQHPTFYTNLCSLQNSYNFCICSVWCVHQTHFFSILLSISFMLYALYFILWCTFHIFTGVFSHFTSKQNRLSFSYCYVLYLFRVYNIIQHSPQCRECLTSITYVYYNT